jgi:hypothetical protein
MPDSLLSWAIALGFIVVFAIFPLVGLYYSIKVVLGRDNIHTPRGRIKEDEGPI